MAAWSGRARRMRRFPCSVRNPDDDAEIAVIAVIAVIVVLVLGVGTTFWSLVGLGRVLYARVLYAGRRRQFPRHRRPHGPAFGLRRRRRAEHLRRRRWARRPTPSGAAPS